MQAVSLLLVTILSIVFRPCASCPESYVECASEGGTCTFSGERSVAYGEQSTYAYLTATDSIACTNGVFGDPLGGVTKKCCYSDAEYTLILDHKDVAQGVFSASLLSSGLENENDPSANTYSIIGNLDADELRDDNGGFNFKLVFTNMDDTVDELVWSQESWLTEATIVGADLSSISDSYSGTDDGFNGLARSSSSSSYLDGTDQHGDWWHGVGAVATHDGGIPGHQRKIAKGVSLYMIIDELDCDHYNIDVFLNECSADFPAEKEALEAVEVRVSQLESDTATSDSLATTDAAVDALSAELLTLQSAAANTSANLATTDATVEVLSADLSTLESEAAKSADLAATDIAVGELSSRLDSLEESDELDALESRLAELESWKEEWQTFSAARKGSEIEIEKETQKRKFGKRPKSAKPANSKSAADVYVFDLSAISPMMVGALALLAVLVAANLYFVFRSCSARAKGKFVDFADSEEMAPIRV